MKRAEAKVRHEESRAEILGAAAGFIADSGFHGMSMRELARATGKAPASFYNYFDSKEELLFALQEGSFAELVSGAEAALADARGPSERLLAFIGSHTRYVAEHPALMRVLVHEAKALPAAQRRRVRALKERYFAIARGVVREVLAPAADGGPAIEAEVERATYAVFGMLNWVYGWYDRERHGTPADVAATLHRIALFGLGGRS